MTTKTITGTYAGGYTLKTAYYGLDITASAKVEGAGVRVTRTGAVANAGSVTASGASDGLYMANGGTVTNTGVITGETGVLLASLQPTSPIWSSVVNHGYIGGRDIGVLIDEAGQLSNYGAVHGADYGVSAGGGGTIRNAGTISSALFGVAINGGGTRLYNGSASDITALVKAPLAVIADYSESYVTNFGTISGTSLGVYLENGARLVNGGAGNAGSVQAADGVYGNAANTLIFNYGTIAGEGSAGDSGVRLAGGGEVQNRAGATISGFTGATIANAGLVRTYGLIDGTGVGSRAYGVLFTDGGDLYNGVRLGQAGGAIEGYKAVVIDAAAGYVFNGGRITSSGAHTAGVAMATGRLANGDANDFAARIVGAYGVSFSGAGTIANYGEIEGATYYGVVIGGGGVVNGSAKDKGALILGNGDAIDAFGAATVVNFGTVHANSGRGVYLTQGGSVTNGGAKTPAR